MRMAGLVRIAIVFCLSLALLPLAVAAARTCTDVAGCGASAPSCLGIGEGSPCGNNKGTCVALSCSAVLRAVCKCETANVSIEPGDGNPMDSLQIFNPLSGSCVRQQNR